MMQPHKSSSCLLIRHHQPRSITKFTKYILVKLVTDSFKGQPTFLNVTGVIAVGFTPFQHISYFMGDPIVLLVQCSVPESRSGAREDDIVLWSRSCAA